MGIRGEAFIFLAIIFTISSANAADDNSCSGLFGKPVPQKCKQDFCEAYASAAATTVQLAIQNGCVQADHGRWNLSKDDHLNACLNWANDDRNGGMAALNETYGRAQKVSECLAQKAGVPSPLHFTGHGPFTGDDNPTLDSFCGGYGFTAGQQIAAHVQGDRVIASLQLCHEFTGSRWDPNLGNHSQACVGWGNQSGTKAGETSANETTARTQGVIACEVRNITPPPVVTPPPTTVTVLLDSDVFTHYDSKTGKVSSKQPNGLGAGTAGVTLLESHPPYFDLQWPGGSGWVYSAPDYLALKLP